MTDQEIAGLGPAFARYYGGVKDAQQWLLTRPLPAGRWV